MSVQRRLIVLLAAMGSVLALGTAGYMLIEGWSAFDGLYMTVITVGSVGYGETHPLSTWGRAFTIMVIVIGLGVAGYGLSTVTALVVEGQLTGLIEQRKMEKKIKDLRGHVILVGWGDTARNVADELMKAGTPFVVIERDRAIESSLERPGTVLYIIGDAADTAVLQQARIETARGLITATSSDKDNIFVILTARELNPKLRIVSRFVTEESQTKLIRAGANVTVSSDKIGGLRMASEMLRPHVVSFLDAMLRETAGTAVRVEEVEVPPDSPWVGRTLAEVRIQDKVGVVVFGLREAATGRYLFNPAPTSTLAAGDVLIGCADRDQITSFRRLVAGRQ